MDIMSTCNLLILKELDVFMALLWPDSSTFAPVSGPQLDLDPDLDRRPAAGWTSSRPPRLTLSWDRELVPGQRLGENCPHSIRPRE